MKKFRITTPQNHPFMDHWNPCFVEEIEIENNDSVEIHPVTGQIVIYKFGCQRDVAAVYPNTVIFEHVKEEDVKQITNITDIV